MAAIAVAMWLSAAPVGAVVVPPAAPAPTAQGPSPEAPDPYPPAGGIGPDGQLVGGPLLRSRDLVAPAGAPAPPASVDAAAWSLVDLDTGNVLAGRDVHGRYPPASILKIFTAAVVLPALPGDHVVSPSNAAMKTECACAGLLAGGSYTVDNLASGLLLVSGNDAAVALAEAYGGVDKTVAAMNAEALRLGAYDTFVETPSGLDGWQQLTSAYDMAVFLRAAIDQPRFVALDAQPTATLPAQHTATVSLDPVRLVNQTDNFLTKVPGAIAAKIGYTDAAQHTYIAAAQRDGRRLGVVLLRGQNHPLDQWQQVAQLLDWGYALPAATPAVGHLDVPTAPTVASSAKASAAGAGASVRTSARSANIGWGIVAGLGLAAPLAALELRRRRRRVSERPRASGS